MNQSVKKQCVNYMNCMIDYIGFAEKNRLIPIKSLMYGVEDDFQHRADSLYNHLVTSGFPLEFSWKFETNYQKVLRFAIEPGSPNAIGERKELIKERFLNLLNVLKLNEQMQNFETIYKILFDNRLITSWISHFGFDFTSNSDSKLKIYFAPFPKTINNVEIEKYQDYMEDFKKCQIETRKRVVKLFEAFGMEKSISDFQEIYKILMGEDTLEQKGSFITFVAADFQKDKEPSFKVYFNPNIS